MKKTSVAVLAATGMVGQRYVSMLSDRPYFDLVEVTGQSSVGKRYGEAAWSGLPLSEKVRNLKVKPTDPSALKADLIFSPLPTDVAQNLEPKLAKAGFNVITDASPHRMDPDVPLMIPEVNPDHLGIIERQRRIRDWKGFIVATPS